MADDPQRTDPKGTMETVPPPKGAKDAYSAPTRVGTLPEHVLAVMREQEASDAAVLSRTRTGMRAAVTSPLAPPPLPRSLEAPVEAAPVEAAPVEAAPVEAANVASQSHLHTAGAWLPLLPAPPPSVTVPPLAPRMTPLPPASIGLVRSILVVAAFALLGALVAVAIMFAGS
jgi:ribonuclease E